LLDADFPLFRGLPRTREEHQRQERSGHRPRCGRTPGRPPPRRGPWRRPRTDAAPSAARGCRAGRRRTARSRCNRSPPRSSRRCDTASRAGRSRSAACLRPAGWPGRRWAIGPCRRASETAGGRPADRRTP
jgi:hypothetical protein